MRAVWAQALDFVGPRVRVALWAWGLLVAGLAASMAVSEEAQHAFNARQEAQSALTRLERAKKQRAIAQAVPRAVKEHEGAASMASGKALDAAALRQAARMATLLGFPWTPVIERIEQSAMQEHAVLTGLSIDVSSLSSRADAAPDVRLQAAVQDDAAALRWVDAHGEGAQLLGRDLLTHPFDTTAGHYALRAEALWSAGGLP
jgi:hypothetical protein